MQQDGSATVAPGSAEDGGLTVVQAAERLGISTDSVRRRLKAGEMTGHQRQTKHGPSWCVHPDEPQGLRDRPATVVPTVSPPLRDPGATVAQGLDGSDGDIGPAEPVAGTALMQAEAMAVYTRSVLEPLVAALERSEARVAELERETGRVTAELAAERAARATLEAQIASQAPTAAQPAPPAAAATVEATTTWWRRWRLWVAGSLTVVLLGSASCQAGGFASTYPNVCEAGRQHLRFWDKTAGGVRARQGEEPKIFIPAAGVGRDETGTWDEIATVAAFLKTYC